jgi:hypothetical protein
MNSWMTLSAIDDGVAVEWETEADVFGRVAQMGQRVVNPVANRVVKRFFSSVQDRLHERTLADVDAPAANDDTDAADDADGGSLVDRVLGRSKGDTDRS